MSNLFEKKLGKAVKQAFGGGDDHYFVFVSEFKEVVENRLAVVSVSISYTADSGIESGCSKLVIAIPTLDHKIGLAVLFCNDFHISIKDVELVQDKLTIIWTDGQTGKEQECSSVVAI